MSSSESMDTDLTNTNSNVFDIELGRTKEGVKTIKSIEGYIIIVTNLHEESTEDDILDIFEEFGSISNIHLNLDRQSGYVKGYALLEFNNFENSINAIKNLNNTELLGQTIFVDFAFTENKKKNNNSDNNDNDYRNYKMRDKSPIR